MVLVSKEARNIKYWVMIIKHRKLNINFDIKLFN